MHMSTLIQIRNVPEEVHAQLKQQASAFGKSLNSYMLEILEREIKEDSIQARREAVLRKHRNAPRRHFIPASAELIRRDRDEREAEAGTHVETVKSRDRS